MNMFKPKNILVTGGAGFIGSHFIDYMLTNYSAIKIINLDKLTYAANLNNLKNCANNSRYYFQQGDILEQSLVENLLATYEIDTIVHFAAETHVDNSIAFPDAFVKTNILGTHSLLNAALNYWRKKFDLDKNECRFHHISTDEVFGALAENEPAFTKNSQFRPNSPYSASKASSDHLVRAYYKTYQLPVTVSNCSNNYGLNQHPEKFIPKIMQSCFHWQPIPIYGSGSNIRDWLHVQDHCHAIDKILHCTQVGENFLIGGNSELTNLTLANRICDLMDEFSPKKMPHKELLTFVPDRLGHDWRYSIDNTETQEKLDWKPEIGIDEGLKELIHAWTRMR